MVNAIKYDSVVVCYVGKEGREIIERDISPEDVVCVRPGKYLIKNYAKYTAVPYIVMAIELSGSQTTFLGGTDEDLHS